MKRANGAQSLSSKQRVVLALAVSSLASVLLFLVNYIHYGSHVYWFLNWNLLLAWVPLFFAWQLIKWLKKGAWLDWRGIVLSLFWLGFLPNSFYISSDLIHLKLFEVNNTLYSMVMLLSFSINGFLLGFTSLYLVHKQLIKRVTAKQAHTIAAFVILLCSFAIYLGRYLRWNSWDIIINPAGLLFDVSERVINPAAHPQTFVTTASFFVLLGSIYVVIWQMAAALKNKKSDL